MMIEDCVIHFFSGKKEYRSLSNFWENEVSILDSDENIIRVYESGEHCFHGEKYIRLSEVCEDENRKKILLEYGKNFVKPSKFKNCVEVKRMGGKKGLLLNNEELKKWIRISIDVQREICKWKYDNYEEVRDDIEKSGDKILIHPALRCSEKKVESRIWEGRAILDDEGKIKILGKNLLGNIWMELRTF